MAIPVLVDYARRPIVVTISAAILECTTTTGIPCAHQQKLELAISSTVKGFSQEI